MARGDLQFVAFELRQALEAADARVAKHVATLTLNDLLSRSVDTLVDESVARFSLDAPVLREADIQVSQNEAQIDVSHDPMRHVWDRNRPFYLQGTRIVFHVPYTGDRNLFGARASRYTMNPPRAVVHDTEVEFVYESLDHNAEQVRSEFERDLNSTRDHLAWVRADIDQFHAGLPQRARQLIESRREKLLKDQGMIANLGFPLRRREDAPTTYVAPNVRRKPAIVRPPSAAAFKPEPALEEKEYDHIIRIIDNMVKVMERSPEAFASMKEEDLRQHFLVQLNGQYEGQATGETFNHEGKTDILVRVDNRNVFIAECKFWQGPKAFGEALNQLLGYATWRDGKLALIIFNRTKNFSSVLVQLAGLVRSHPNFVRDVKWEHGETGWRFVLHHVSDVDRELILTVLAYDVPQ
jgi:hypothetical protein